MEFFDPVLTDHRYLGDDYDYGCSCLTSPYLTG